MSVKRWSLFVLLGWCICGGSWFLSRSLKLARETANQSDARAYVKRIDEAQTGFAKNNPASGFACRLDDLRHAGLQSPSESKYDFELHCDMRKKSPEMEYLVAAYPADKRADGVWGFWVFCSDQTGKIWGELSREEMRNNLSRSEKAGLYDFEGICRRDVAPENWTFAHH
jgi:hypothetical protein